MYPILVRFETVGFLRLSRGIQASASARHDFIRYTNQVAKLTVRMRRAIGDVNPKESGDGGDWTPS